MKCDLSVLMVGLDVKKIMRTIDSIMRLNQRGSMELILMHNFDEKKIEKIITRYKHCARRDFCLRCYPIYTKFHYISEESREKKYVWKLRKYIKYKKAVDAFQLTIIDLMQRGFMQGLNKCRGLYWMPLLEGTVLIPDFWKKSVSVLKKRKDVYTYFAPIRYRNIGGYEFVNDKLDHTYQLTNFERGTAMFDFLQNTNHMDSIMISKKRRLFEKNRTFMVEESAYSYYFDCSFVHRMGFEKTIKCSGYLAERELSDQDKRDFDNLFKPMLRISFLKAQQSFFETQNSSQKELIGLKNSYSRAVKDVSKDIENLYLFYEKKKEEEISRRYCHLYKALM